MIVHKGAKAEIFFCLVVKYEPDFYIRSSVEKLSLPLIGICNFLLLLASNNPNS
jgi:hypothetical protein